MPFADLTTGKDTYPAGRYLDIHPTSTGFYTIDFNMAYNPTCAYNETYDCPFPPPSNRLEGRDSRRRKGSRLVTTALQAIIFDFDGVIADSEPLHFRAFQQTLAEDGLELSPQEYYARYLGYDDVGMFQAFGEDRGVPMDDARVAGLVTRKGQKLQAMLTAGAVLFPGAIDFIRSAAGAVPIAIASGALRHEIDEMVSRPAWPACSRPSSRRATRRKASHRRRRTGWRSSGCASRRRAARPGAVRGDRGLALGARIRTRSRVTLCGGDQQLPGRRAAQGPNWSSAA